MPSDVPTPLPPVREPLRITDATVPGLEAATREDLLAALGAQQAYCAPKRSLLQIDTFDGIDQTFTYHTPKGDQPERYVALREQARELARRFVLSCPMSPERTLALRHLQQAVMFANASIAIHED